MARRDRRRQKSNGASMAPRSWEGGWADSELEDLFRGDPALHETARLLRASRPDPEPDPHYRNRLRAQLIEEGRRSLQPHGLSRWLRLRPAHLAWGGAALGTAAIAVTAVALFGTHVADHETVTAYSTIAARHAVSPNDVITVAFNQPMDHAIVEAGLDVEPATRVTTSWQGNDLVITPVHHLAGNTPYTVTIAKQHLVASSGAKAARALQITFGTAPTPPPAPAEPTPPSLTASQLGLVAGGSGLLFAPDGSVVSTEGYAPTSTPGAPGTPPSSAPGATARPRATSSASPRGTPTPAVNSVPVSLLEYGAPGSATSLGPPASAAAFAPGGATLAAAVSDANGGSEIVASQPDGTLPHALVDSPAPIIALTWASSDRIVYATAAEIASVDLSGATRVLASPSGSVVELAPGGANAYLAPADGQPGRLLDVGDGSSRALDGSPSEVAFSGDGSTVAWVSNSGSEPQLLTEQVKREGAAPVSVLDPAARISSVALNQDGTAVAYTLAPSNGVAEVVVAQLPSGTAVAIGPPATSEAFSPRGDKLALLTQSPTGLVAELASIPGGGAAGQPASTGIPATASSALRAFVDAQARGDLRALAPLSAPGVDAARRTPHRLSRAYVVDSLVEPDGSVQASIELIADPTSAASARVADETLTLTSAGAGQPYLVTGLMATSLHDQASGPHVLNVSGAATQAGFVVQVSFDSDLNPFTVPVAITVLTADGTRLAATVTYDADTRTAVITLPGFSTGGLKVTVGTALHDVNGQVIATAFRTQLRAG